MRKKTINPCKICLVQSMCKVGCRELEVYIYTVTEMIPNPDRRYDKLATLIRQGEIVFYNNDTKWRWEYIKWGTRVENV